MPSSHLDCPASIQRDKNFISLVQCNEAFRFLIPWLVGVLQVRPSSEIHPANLYTFVLATSIYCFAFTTETKLNQIHPTTDSSETKNSQLFGVIAFISGSLSSALLLYMLVQRLTGCMILISWALLSILVVHQQIPLNNKETYKMLGRKIKSIKIPQKISSLWSKNESELPRDGRY